MNRAVLDHIAIAKAAGRPVILASASHRRHIVRVARHLGLFDEIIASTARVRAKGRGKLALILAMTGGRPFDYIGDARADVPIWAAARQGYSVGHCPSGVIWLGPKPRFGVSFRRTWDRFRLPMPRSFANGTPRQ
jgi:hypothetical protein